LDSHCVGGDAESKKRIEELEEENRMLALVDLDEVEDLRKKVASFELKSESVQDDSELLDRIKELEAENLKLKSGKDVGVGKEAYEKRAGGAKWRECPGASPINSARAYAKSHGMVWPPETSNS
jgi:hypothetical protein